MAEPNDLPGSPARQMHFTLHPDPSTRGWQADLQADGGSRHFDSLAVLIAWLARLEPPSPPRGIR